MNINNENIDLSDLFSQKYMHKEIQKGMFLSEYQIEVLQKYYIDPNNVGSISEIIYLANEILDEDSDADDLESVIREIQEFNYYANTNK